MKWFALAACLGEDTDKFFPQTHDKAQYRPMITQYCARCPVRTDCLHYALEEKIEDGLWGGLSPHERQSYKRSTATRERLRRTG